MNNKEALKLIIENNQKNKEKYENFNPIEFATYEEALSAGIDTLKNRKKGNEV